jgi:hypothetical protein
MTDEKRKAINLYGLFHIIDTDNFCGDYPNEQFIAINISFRPFAETMCEALNSKYGGEHSSRYYRVVEDGYKLVPGFEP